MANEETYEGTCFCGSVALEVSGTPVAQGFCHCESCRTWSASPINGFSLWKLGTVQVTKGAELVGSVRPPAARDMGRDPLDRTTSR